MRREHVGGGMVRLWDQQVGVDVVAEVVGEPVHALGAFIRVGHARGLPVPADVAPLTRAASPDFVAHVARLPDRCVIAVTPTRIVVLDLRIGLRDEMRLELVAAWNRSGMRARVTDGERISVVQIWPRGVDEPLEFATSPHAVTPSTVLPHLQDVTLGDPPVAARQGLHSLAKN